MKPDNRKIQYAFRALLLLLGILGLARGLSMPPLAGLSAGRAAVLNSQWEMAADPQTGITEYRCRIPPDTGGALLLYLKTYLPEFQVLLDGELLYAYPGTDAAQGRSQHIIRLPSDSQEKVLAVRTDSGSYSATGQGRFGNAFLGEEHEVVIKLLRDNLYALVFTVFALLLGAGVLIAACWLRKGLSREMLRSLASFGAFILTTGVWVLTDSELLLLVTNRVAVVSLISFVSFMVMPAFLLRFIKYILGGKQIFDVLCGLFVLLAAAYLLNYLIRAVPGYLLLAPVHLLCVCSVAMVIRTGLKTLKKGKNREVRRVMEGFGLLSIFVIAALVVFAVNPLSGYSSLYCLGIFAFILCLMGAVLGHLYGQIKENADIAAYKSLAYMDAMTGMKNRAAYIEAQRRAENVEGLSCIVLDINNLKRINDRYGHQAGDNAIITAARAIQETFGGTGTCFRIGGDEFVVLLRDCAPEEIAAGLDGMRENLALWAQSRGSSVDIAAGYAVRQEGETVTGMVRRADAGMYREKQRMKAGSGA